MALLKHSATNSFHKVHLENKPSILLSPNTAFASAPASDVESILGTVWSTESQ